MSAARDNPWCWPKIKTTNNKGPLRGPSWRIAQLLVDGDLLGLHLLGLW